MKTEEILQTVLNELDERIKKSKSLSAAAAEKNLVYTMEANDLLVQQYGSLKEFIEKHTKVKPLKDAIIKNGITYKVVRMLYVPGCGQEDPCKKCDLARACDRRQDGNYIQPCSLFHKGNRLAYFKKMI
jgi:hypothetical protein